MDDDLLFPRISRSPISILTTKFKQLQPYNLHIIFYSPPMVGFFLGMAHILHPTLEDRWLPRKHLAAVSSLGTSLDTNEESEIDPWCRLRGSLPRKESSGWSEYSLWNMTMTMMYPCSDTKPKLPAGKKCVELCLLKKECQPRCQPRWTAKNKCLTPLQPNLRQHQSQPAIDSPCTAS